MPLFSPYMVACGQGAHTLKLKMVALELDSVVVVLGPVWAAVLLIDVLSPTLPIPCANKGMLRVSARGEAARVRAPGQC